MDDGRGTVGRVRGCATEGAAQALAQDWLGCEREVPIEKVPYSALNWIFTAVTGRSLR